MPRLSEELVTEMKMLERAISVSVADETYAPSHFGDALLTMKGPEHAVRFLRDRGQIFMDIAGTDGDWRDANGVLEAARLHPSPGKPLSARELVPVICSHFEEIKRFL